jgi:hypothetical protein
MIPPAMQQFFSRSAIVFGLLAWLGVIHALLAPRVTLGAHSTIRVVEASGWEFAGLACGLLATISALGAIDDFADFSEWLRLAFCVLPFVFLLRSLDPFHMFPA